MIDKNSNIEDLLDILESDAQENQQFFRTYRESGFNFRGNSKVNQRPGYDIHSWAEIMSKTNRNLELECYDIRLGNIPPEEAKQIVHFIKTLKCFGGI